MDQRICKFEHVFAFDDLEIGNCIEAGGRALNDFLILVDIYVLSHQWQNFLGKFHRLLLAQMHDRGRVQSCKSLDLIGFLKKHDCPLKCADVLGQREEDQLVVANLALLQAADFVTLEKH